MATSVKRFFLAGAKDGNKEAPAILCTFTDYFGLAAITPTLPYYLAEIGTEHVAAWTGLILSIQFVGVVLGNVVWGRVADKKSAKFAMQMTIAGDVVLFAATSFARPAPVLLVVRAFAGFFSPLVPSLAYIFEHISDPVNLVEAVSRYGTAVMIGQVVGSAFVGLTYKEIGWVGTNLVCTALALFTLFQVLALDFYDAQGNFLGFKKYIWLRLGDTKNVLVAPCNLLAKACQPYVEEAKAPKAPYDPAAPKLSNILRSKSPAGWFLLMRAFTIGWVFIMSTVMLIYVLSERYGYPPRFPALCLMACVVLNGIVMFRIVPWTVRRYGPWNVCSLSGFTMMLSAGALCFPPVFEKSSAILFIFFDTIFLVTVGFQQGVNQASAKLVAMELNLPPGQFTGMSRVFFALGQATAPLTLILYAEFGPTIPFLAFAVVKAAELVIFHGICRVPIFKPYTPGAQIVHQVTAADLAKEDHGLEEKAAEQSVEDPGSEPAKAKKRDSEDSDAKSGI
ncbi:major facilitator superfamily domain-containing protein [Pelagophyceae sp. CCMP2097]|nr:major facilitator superfamily domain-containing protein [Pelagophyceae sp. CCMP2097]|mmetsp:Transcript_15387/g.51843  ORF Transcript_15387/g.51843 Transcript_15387/m.51843 type:complete len:507 (+) Transcript_15387:199-1719(+)